MNCLEIRRAILADPRRTDDDISTHTVACADCKEFVERTRQSNKDIEQALKIRVPEGLQARLLLRRSISESRQRWRLGLAAAAALLAAVLVWQVAPMNTGLTPEIAALKAEVQGFAVSVADRDAPARMPPAEIDALFAKVGIAVDDKAGPIAAAKPCYIQRALGAHLTLATEKGLVNVLILPHSELDAPLDFSTKVGLIGRILPCPKGSIAIIGGDAEAIDLVFERFEGAVSWI